MILLVNNVNHLSKYCMLQFIFFGFVCFRIKAGENKNQFSYIARFETITYIQNTFVRTLSYVVKHHKPARTCSSNLSSTDIKECQERFPLQIWETSDFT